MREVIVKSSVSSLADNPPPPQLTRTRACVVTGPSTCQAYPNVSGWRLSRTNTLDGKAVHVVPLSRLTDTVFPVVASPRLSLHWSTCVWLQSSVHTSAAIGAT